MRPLARIVMLVTTFGAMGCSAEDQGVTQPIHSPGGLPVEGRLPSLDGATGWLNGTALTPETLRGKVVLVEFWTYSCINWLRTEPYVREWARKYRDHGLVVL